VSGPNETTGSGRVDHLDGIRALAIAGVLGTHWVDNYLPFGSGGHIGVDLFFALSGFIITTILWRGAPGASVAADVGTFLARRVRRLYPALTGLVVGCVVIAAFLPFGPYDALDVARQGVPVLAQVSWWDLSHGTFDTIFGHTWSLGVEWVFYLLWPWLLLVLHRRGTAPGRAAAVAGALAAASYAGSFAVDEFWFTYSPLGRTGVMLAGSALALVLLARPGGARAATAGRLGPRALDALAVVAVLAFTVYTLVGYPTFDPGVRWVGVPLATGVGAYLIWFGYVRAAGPVRALLTLPVLTLVGRTSYSIYLWHIPPLLVLDKDRIDLPTPLLGLVGLTFAVTATALSHRYLERPFLRSRGTLLATGADPAPGTATDRKAPTAG
jgi:peptidoglycan/LPS O-acetylase OafA/YrhL